MKMFYVLILVVVTPYVCVCVYIYVYIYIYIHTHIYLFVKTHQIAHLKLINLNYTPDFFLITAFNSRNSLFNFLNFNFNFLF